MNTKKAITFFLINTLLLGAFPDFRISQFHSYPYSEFTTVDRFTLTNSVADPSAYGSLPSPKSLLATPTPTPTPIPTATPKPTATPVPLGDTQSLLSGELTFQYPETATLNTDTSTYTLLVNKEYPLPSTYIPYMVEPDVEIYHKGINERRYLQPIAATALKELFDAAAADGLELVMRCGFRSYPLQKAIFFSTLKTAGYYETTRFHALEGTSEHQTGLAVDLCCEATDYQNNYNILKTPEYAWLVKNAHRYGWILRYPADKTDITGYNFEPWHFRYVGVELATYLKEQDLVLEEYYGALPTTNLIILPKEYEKVLSDEDKILMQKDIEEYEKRHAEATPKPTATPAPTPEMTPETSITPEPTTPEPTATPEPDQESELPILSPTPTPDTTERSFYEIIP